MERERGEGEHRERDPTQEHASRATSTAERADTSSAVICFCRLPSPGKTKTRLARGLSTRVRASLESDCRGERCLHESAQAANWESLGALAAASMYEVMVSRALYAAAACANTHLVVAMVSDADDKHTFQEWIKENVCIQEKHAVSGRRVQVMVAVQEQVASLGERMAAAVRRAMMMTIHDREIETVVVIGTDIPDLHSGIIDDALALLHVGKNSKTQMHCDVVLGPAKDGGFYLIGATSSCSYGNGDIYHMLSTLFDGIKWSTDTVLQETVQKAQEMDISINSTSLPTLTDIDTIHDLRAWMSDGIENDKHTSVHEDYLSVKTSFSNILERYDILL